MQGLITKDRKGIDPAAAPFARGYGPEEVEGLKEGASLLEVVSIHQNSSCRLDYRIRYMMLCNFFER